MFSSRFPARLTRNALSEAETRARSAGAPLLDLTVTNPTAVGLPYPPDLLAPLADPRAACYRPDPLGMREARDAVAGEYARRGVPADPDRIVLTASTSEAYAFLFKLLCNPDDTVLTPQPSYPLFEWLTALEGVRAAPYRLDPAGAWAIDRESFIRALSPGARAALVVSPNNPTGSMLRARDRAWLVAIAAERGLALIADEVFADYTLAPRGDAASLAGEPGALTFTLGGLSKSAGLPHVKLGWILVSGPDALVAPALERLALVADTYLSVSTPVQVAAARLIDAGRDVRRAIQARLQQNLARLRVCVDSHPSLTLIEPEGGWSAVLRVPAIDSDEATALRLVREAHVLVQPGYFFDFDEHAFIVVSLLIDPVVFDEGIVRVARCLEGAA